MSHPGLVTNKHLQNKKRGKTKKKKKRGKTKQYKTHTKRQKKLYDMYNSTPKKIYRAFAHLFFSDTYIEVH